MLDDVQRRRLLEQPAGEHLAPVWSRGVLDHDLHECARQLVGFPIGRRLAGFKLDDEITDADALTWLQLQVTRQAVALVEDTQRGNPLRHGRVTFLGLNERFDLRAGFRRGLCWRSEIANDRRGHGNSHSREQHANDGRPLHPASGVHAS